MSVDPFTRVSFSLESCGQLREAHSCYLLFYGRVMALRASGEAASERFARSVTVCVSGLKMWRTVLKCLKLIRNLDFSF